MFTPDVSEGWLFQTGDVTGSTATLYRYRSRPDALSAFGSGFAAGVPELRVTIPGDAAFPWTSEPVWFRVGKITTLLGQTPYLIPRLPLWR